MSEVLNKPWSLTLNKLWQPIDVLTIAEAITKIASDGARGGGLLPMDIQTPIESDQGDAVPLVGTPVTWEQWITLPVREGFDVAISVSRGRQIRAPIVTTARAYDKVTIFVPTLTRRAVFERDKGMCMYTGVYVPWSEGNIDHVIPRDMGGRSTWENLVWTKREINSMKANRTPAQAGLRLLRKPVAPKGLTAWARILREQSGRLAHPLWAGFVEGAA